jgi:hypothetical protein
MQFPLNDTGIEPPAKSLAIPKTEYMNNELHKGADIPFLSRKAESPGMIVERVVFTAGEHLRAQQQIERRAREIWCAGGYRRGTALNDWLQAECEVLEQFIWAYARRHALRQSLRRGISISGARKRPGTRILKRGRTFPVREPQSTSSPG